MNCLSLGHRPSWGTCLFVFSVVWGVKNEVDQNITNSDMKVEPSSLSDLGIRISFRERAVDSYSKPNELELPKTYSFDDDTTNIFTNFSQLARAHNLGIEGI